jgi:RimJ/RimL family protein N-acetyltransferase
VLIRNALTTDALSLLSVSSGVMQEEDYSITEPDEFVLSEEQEQEWIRAHADDPGKIILVAEVAGSVVGLLSFKNGNRRRIAHNGTLGLSIRKEWRERGLGTILLQTLLEWAEENPLIEKVCLAVLATNARAIGLYQKLGFVEEGRRPKAIKIAPGRYIDEVLMYRFV